MGYDVNITRARHWAENVGHEIQPEEWHAIVAADPEFEMRRVAQAGDLRYENPLLARWTAHPDHEEVWVDYSSGNLVVKNPDMHILRKLLGRPKFAECYHLSTRPRTHLGDRTTNTLAILRSIRDGRAHDWESLCHSLGVPVDGRHVGSSRNVLLRRLEDLVTLCFVEVEDWPNHNRPPAGAIRVGDNWVAVQGALGISLTDLVRLSSGDAMIARPFHGKPRDGFYPDIFVIMPFEDALKEVYEKHIKKVVRSIRVPLQNAPSSTTVDRKPRLGLVSVRRADDFFSSTSIVSDVWNAICSAKVVIADCSHRNPNVFYELGMVHAVGTPVILITQDRSDVPFDISHIRYIRYERTPQGMKVFESSLRRSLRELFDDRA